MKVETLPVQEPLARTATCRGAGLNLPGTQEKDKIQLELGSNGDPSRSFAITLTFSRAEMMKAGASRRQDQRQQCLCYR
jgi:hypothetical protein